MPLTPKCRKVLLLLPFLAIYTFLWISVDLTVHHVAIVPEDSSMSVSALPWNQAIQEATRLLYRDCSFEERDYWLHQPPPSIYIYDNLPSEYSNISHISSCVNEKFLGANGSTTWKDRFQNCLWEPQVCDDHKLSGNLKQKMFISHRNNYNLDVAYLAKFRKYPYRVYDPSKADLFLVPYPHKSHCLCHKDFAARSSRCAVPFDDIQRNVLDQLDHIPAGPTSSLDAFTRTLERRHVFLYGGDWWQQLKPFGKQTSRSISLSLGPSVSCYSRLCGHVVVPYVSTGADYQPSVVAQRPIEWWTQRERPVMVGAAFGATQNLPLRVKFLRRWKEWLGDSMDGKPHYIIGMGQQRTPSEDFMQLYRNSTFCPILPGDGCAQKRFFDVILNGCLPLVPVYTSNEKGIPSFFNAGACSIRVTYPFSKGLLFNSSRSGFDIMDVVLPYNGTCGFPCMKEAMVALLANATALEEKRRRMRDYASVVTFGLSSESDGHVDAFVATLVQLRHFAWQLLHRVPAF